MARAPIPVRARVRHRADRSYAVLVVGPDGEVEVGVTRFTGDILRLARAGTARAFGVEETELAAGSVIRMPQPPWTRDGQWVRIVSAEVPEETGMLGQAHWLPRQGCWGVVLAASAGGYHATEELDFAPVIAPGEAEELRAHLQARTSRPD